MIYYVRGACIISLSRPNRDIMQHSDFVFEVSNSGIVNFIKNRDMRPNVGFFKIQNALNMIERHYEKCGFVVEYEIFETRFISEENYSEARNDVISIIAELNNGISVLRGVN